MRRSLFLVVSVAAIAAPSTASAQRWGREKPPANGVCFYQDHDFDGDYFCVAGGSEVAGFTSKINDKISSLKIFGGATVTVFRDSQFRGQSTKFAGDVRDLSKEGWEDKISSLRVLSGGGSTLTAGNADQVVRRAYNELLNREPDPQGFQLYRNHMVNDGWSEDRVRDALRSSPEYRTKGGMTAQKAQEIVRAAYLSVLKREPDPGAAPFVNKVLNERWSQQDVERELRNSDEYKKKQ